MWKKVLVVATCLYVVNAAVTPSIFQDEGVLPELTRTARSCGFTECNTFCRKLGHARGVCIGNLCQCRFRRRRSVEEEFAVKNAGTRDDTAEVTNGE